MLECREKWGNTDLFLTAAPSPAKGRRRKLCNNWRRRRAVCAYDYRPKGLAPLQDLFVGRRLSSGEKLALAWPGRCVASSQTPEGARNWQNIQTFKSINDSNFRKKCSNPVTVMTVTTSSSGCSFSLIPPALRNMFLSQCTAMNSIASFQRIWYRPGRIAHHTTHKNHFFLLIKCVIFRHSALIYIFGVFSKFIKFLPHTTRCVSITQPSLLTRCTVPTAVLLESYEKYSCQHYMWANCEFLVFLDSTYTSP